MKYVASALHDSGSMYFWFNVRPELFFKAVEDVLKTFYTSKYRMPFDPFWILVRYDVKRRKVYSRPGTNRQRAVVHAPIETFSDEDMDVCMVEHENNSYKLYVEFDYGRQALLITRDFAVFQALDATYTYRNYSPVSSYTALLAKTAIRSMMARHYVSHDKTVSVTIDENLDKRIDQARLGALLRNGLLWLRRRELTTA